MKVNLRVFSFVVGVAIGVAPCQKVAALPMIAGEINMSGQAVFISGPSSCLDTVSGVASIAGSMVQDTSTGTFQSMSVAIDPPTSATLPVNWSGFTWSPVGLPSPLWQFAYNGVTYTFTLDTIAIAQQNCTSISLTGAGIITATGYDPTPGAWTFDCVANAAGNSFPFESSVRVVPDGGLTMTLLGMAILGVEYLRRRSVSRNR